MTLQNESRSVATGGFDKSSLIGGLDNGEIARKFVSAQAAYDDGARFGFLDECPGDRELGRYPKGYQLGISASLTSALKLGEWGLPCFPCRADKRPATPRGFKDATCDRNVVREVWMRYPGPLIGIPTGEISGLDILDIDPRHGGERWFAEHKNRLPPTRVHRTRSGGLHLLFQHETGMRCSAGRIADGVDVRATGGYVIWWPAVGIPVLSETPTAAWPDWLLVQLSLYPRPANSRITVPDGHAPMRLVQLIVRAQAGERNNITYWAACRAGEMVVSGLLGADAAAAVIAEAGTRAGLPRSEAERTARSGIHSTGGPARA